MNARWLCGLLLAAVLAGCSDEEDDGPGFADARDEAPIESAEDAARLAAYIPLIGQLDEVADNRNLDQDFRNKAARATLKFRLEDNCPGGGDFAIFDDNNPDMLTLQFNNCVTDTGEALDGMAVLQCQAGSFEDDSCSNVLITYGEGSERFQFRSAQGQASLLGSWRLINVSTSVRLEQSLEFNASDSASGARLFTVTRNFFRDVEQDGAGGGLASIGGSAGGAFDGPNIDCASGLITFTTRQPIAVDSNGSLVGGRISVSNQSGQTADVAFNADGGVTVTYNGATVDFSRSRFEQFCAFDF